MGDQLGGQALCT